MKSRSRLLLSSVVLTLMSTGLHDPLRAQEPALGFPGPEHDELLTLVGAWEVSIAGEPAGSGMVVPRLGRRFIELELSLDAGPFRNAIYTLGFDSRHEEYTVIAMDDSGTYWVTGRGARDANTVPMYGQDEDPVMRSMGLDKEYVIELRLHSSDRFDLETRLIDTRTPERREIPFLKLELIRVTKGGS